MLLQSISHQLYHWNILLSTDGQLEFLFIVRENSLPSEDYVHSVLNVGGVMHNQIRKNGADVPSPIGVSKKWLR